MEKGFLIDVSRCVGCYSCVVACQDQNDLQNGSESWRSVVKFEYRTYREVSTISISISCMHCGIPPCVEICPTKAITKRKQDGIVVLREERCIGCRMCLTICPFGALQIGKDRKIHKCNYCLDWAKQGSEPACVKVCPFGALYAGTLEELEKISRKKVDRRFMMSSEPFFFLKRV